MIEISINNAKRLTIENDSKSILIDGSESNQSLIQVADSSYKVLGEKSISQVDIIDNNGKEITMSIDNTLVSVTISDHIDQVLEKLGMNIISSTTVKEIKAPMPGSILDILVQEGDSVKSDDKLLVLEAMKMENVIKSPGEALVSKIHVDTKENVEKNQVLISFE